MKSKTGYPITKESLLHLSEIISAPISKKSCVSLLFKPEFGGATTLIRLLLDNKSEFSFFNSTKYKTYYIEATEILEPSKIGFFRKMLCVCANKKSKNNNYAKLSFADIVNELEIEIKRLCKKQTIIFIFTRLQEYEKFNSEYGNILYSLRDHPDIKTKLFFIFTFYDGLTKSFSDFLKQQILLKQTITDNIVEIKPLGKADTIHSIKFWEAQFGYKISLKNKNLIEELSLGYPYSIKLLCRYLLINQHASKQDLINYLNIKFPKPVYNKISIIENSVILGEKLNATSHFTSLETEILELFIKNTTSIITKDNIAKVIWRDDYLNMYSDQTIDKHISNIRKKLKELDFKGVIRSKKGTGYYLASA